MENASCCELMQKKKERDELLFYQCRQKAYQKSKSTQAAIRPPKMSESRRRLVLIMLSTELIPGICASVKETGKSDTHKKKQDAHDGYNAHKVEVMRFWMSCS